MIILLCQTGFLTRYINLTDPATACMNNIIPVGFVYVQKHGR